jgi:spore coat polysaccharide biosynthesis predicted glycosyltransferase SpsG
MRIAFRVDASAQIGTGHVSQLSCRWRGPLQGRGAEVHFLSAASITPVPGGEA